MYYRTNSIIKRQELIQKLYLLQKKNDGNMIHESKFSPKEKKLLEIYAGRGFIRKVKIRTKQDFRYEKYLKLGKFYKVLSSYNGGLNYA